MKSRPFKNSLSTGSLNWKDSDMETAFKIKAGPGRAFIKKIMNGSVKPLLTAYLSKERAYRYKDVSITILPGVFHPGFFHSTKLLLAVVEKMNLAGKKFLELGAGSGLIAIVAAQRGAKVLASDVSSKAVENIKRNEALTGVEIEIVKSDLFKNIPQQVFDVVVINPPYYDRKIVKDEDFAWYTGEGHDYFEQLFAGLPSYIHAESEVRMVLSDDARLEFISGIAASHHFEMKIIMEKRTFRERHFVFELKLNRK